MLGGQACITGSRQTTAAAATTASSATLPPQARGSANRPGGARTAGAANLVGLGMATGAMDGASTTGATGASITGASIGRASITGATTGGASGRVGAHSLAQRAHRTTRPGARAPGTLYSAAQLGQVISTRRFCGPPSPLATGPAA